MIKALVLSAAMLPAVALAGQKVEVETSMGPFTLELNDQKAPKSVANFIRYVKDGSYVGTQFHRVISGFVAQSGGFDKDFKRLPSYETVVNESTNGLSNATGTIAMARTQDPNSATRQFYINLKDNAFLDGSAAKPGYTVFGKVTDGFDTFKKIASVKTGIKNGMRDVPQKPVVITSVKLLP
ncbi:peptidylprolyl isomerase [Veronia nyctiphanis]|nr:peptidylprolyl isomerase [Veronia nyctiphanis]